MAVLIMLRLTSDKGQKVIALRQIVEILPDMGAAILP